MTRENKDCHSGKVKTAPIRIVHQSFRIVHQCEYQFFKDRNFHIICIKSTEILTYIEIVSKGDIE